MAGRGFQAIDEDEDETSPGPTVVSHPTRQEHNPAAVAAMKLLLATLSQKTLTALSNLVTAAFIFSAWWLWNTVLPEPSNNQLIGVTLYAGFILAVEFLRRR